MFSQTWPTLPERVATILTSLFQLWKWLPVNRRQHQHTGCTTVVTSCWLQHHLSQLAVREGSYLPVRRGHQHAPKLLKQKATHGTHKAVTASREKCNSHSSHLYHLSSCYVIAIYVLTTLTTIPGQQTCGRQSHHQYWNFMGQGDTLIWNKHVPIFYLLFSQSCRNPALNTTLRYTTS